PQQFVTWKAPDGSTQHTTVVGINKQSVLQRITFFGGAISNLFIHHIPMSPSGLWQERPQSWLSPTLQAFLFGAQDGKILNKTPFETFFADIQARLPDSDDQTINGTGLKPALLRIANPHIFVDYGTNTMAKYWAYTHSILGQIDPSVVASQPNYAVFSK